MATILGRDAAVKIATDTITEQASWSLEISADPITEPVFGDTWSKTHGLSTTSWTATVDGLYDPTDTAGQLVLQDSVISGTKITTIRFYEDGTNYWTPNTGADAAAGCYVTSMPITVAQGDVGRISYSVQGTGAIHRTS